MIFSNRNFVPLKISGKVNVILPVYFHVLEKDLDWINDPKIQSTNLDTIKKIIIDNLDEIEKNSKLDSSKFNSFNRLEPQNNIILAVNSTKRTNSFPIILTPSTNIDIWDNHTIASFILNVWVFPFFGNASELILPIDESF